MTELTMFVNMVQRRRIGCDAKEGYLLPLLAPLFMIETHMSFEERLKLFRLCLSLPVGFTACEIGSYLGASTSFLAAAASIRQGHVHAVDTWQNDAMPGERVGDTWEQFQKNVDPYRNWITPHPGLAREVKDRVPHFDLLFIDGDHTYEGTLANLSDFVPKLKEGGVVVMHDFDDGSVQQAMGEYFSNRRLENVELTHTLKSFRPK